MLMKGGKHNQDFNEYGFVHGQQLAVGVEKSGTPPNPKHFTM